MTTQERMIATARNCVGTPFHHQGRNAKAGLDCIGLIVQALKEASVEVQDQTDYARDPDPAVLLAALTAHGFVKVDEVEAGDVLLFRFARSPQHVALAISSTRMIHAYAPLKRVVEIEIGNSWQRRLCGIYRLVV